MEGEGNWLYRVVRLQSGLPLVVVGVSLAVVALACHPLHKHVDGVHSAGDLENWCVELHSTPEIVSQPTAVERIERAIEDNELGWETRDTVNFFAAGSIQCHESVDRSVYEIEFHLWDNVVTDGPCNGTAFACTQFITDGGTHGDPPETDFTKAHVNLPAGEALVGGARWINAVNHETGHTLGLADPTATPGGPPTLLANSQGCTQALDLDNNGSVETFAPVISIMHLIYCRNLPGPTELIWPTIYDFSSFDAFVK